MLFDSQKHGFNFSRENYSHIIFIYKSCKIKILLLGKSLQKSLKYVFEQIKIFKKKYLSIKEHNVIVWKEMPIIQFNRMKKKSSHQCFFIKSMF